MLLREPGHTVTAATIQGFEHHIASQLMRVELRRLGLRTGLLAAADELLTGIAIVPLDADLLSAAEGLPPADVATLDALHLATAVRLAADGELDALMTYDRRLGAGARAHGLTVVAP